MGEFVRNMNETECGWRLRGLWPAPEKGLLVKDTFRWQLCQSLALLNFFGAWTKAKLGTDMDCSSKKVLNA